MCPLRLERISTGFGRKMSQRISFTTKEVLREVAMGSDSDMEPSDDEFTPEMNDSVAELSEDEIIFARKPSTSFGRQKRWWMKK